MGFYSGHVNTERRQLLNAVKELAHPSGLQHGCDCRGSGSDARLLIYVVLLCEGERRLHPELRWTSKATVASSPCTPPTFKRVSQQKKINQDALWFVSRKRTNASLVTEEWLSVKNLRCERLRGIVGDCR